MSKRLMSLPVIGVVVSMLAVSVFAASPTQGAISATDANGNDLGGKIVITRKTSEQGVKGKTAADLDPSGFTPAGDFKASDYEIVEEFDVSYADGITKDDIDWPITIKIEYSSDSTADVQVFHLENGSWVYVGKGDGSAITFTVKDGLSPFAIAKAASTTSAQTGDYAGTYIILVAVALVAAGAVFAVRAKKATK